MALSSSLFSVAPLSVHLPARLIALVFCAASHCVLAAAEGTLDPTTPPTSVTPAKKTPAKIYKYVSAAGTTSFSDNPPASGSYVVVRQDCYACNLHSNVDWHFTQLHTDKFTSEINHAARQFALDPALVRAVIHAESGFNARARSPKGAMGLMQLMPLTARSMGVVDARLPEHNINGGVRYLSTLLRRYGNDITLATAAYNAGPEAVQKYSGVPPYAETQVYVQRVRILHQRYKGAPHG